MPSKKANATAMCSGSLRALTGATVRLAGGVRRLATAFRLACMRSSGGGGRPSRWCVMRCGILRKAFCGARKPSGAKHRERDALCSTGCAVQNPQLLAGANWDNSASCGRRAANCNNVSSNVNANNGGREASATMGLWGVKLNPTAGRSIHLFYGKTHYRGVVLSVATSERGCHHLQT